MGRITDIFSPSPTCSQSQRPMVRASLWSIFTRPTNRRLAPHVSLSTHNVFILFSIITIIWGLSRPTLLPAVQILSSFGRSKFTIWKRDIISGAPGAPEIISLFQIVHLLLLKICTFTQGPGARWGGMRIPPGVGRIRSPLGGKLLLFFQCFLSSRWSKSSLQSIPPGTGRILSPRDYFSNDFHHRLLIKV